MKTIVIIAVAILGMAFAGWKTTKVSTRDYAYEAYCDSIWECDEEYYLDVLEETDEYQDYVELNGIWW